MSIAQRETRVREPLLTGLSGGIRVAVVEEHEIVRRGLVAGLLEDSGLHVLSALPRGPIVEDIDIAVVSPAAARRERFPCPIILCCEDPERAFYVDSDNEVVGVLHRDTLTVAQLRATVHAGAAGLRVNAQAAGPEVEALEPRCRLVLELMAEGCNTREIAERMSYSERTIKKLITALQDRFETRSRAQTVAEAIRRGLI